MIQKDFHINNRNMLIQKGIALMAVSLVENLLESVVSARLDLRKTSIPNRILKNITSNESTG